MSLEMREGSEDERNVCFVCMDPNAPPSKCACTDRHVHDECLMRWLKQINTNTCPVCKEAYEHVDVRITTRRKPYYPFWLACCGAICFVVFMACGGAMLHMYFDPSFLRINLTLALGIAMIAGGVFSLVICLLFGHLSCRNNCKLCEKVSNKTIVLRPVSSV